MLIKKNTPRWLMYIITDNITSSRKIGLTYSDIVCTYKKEGQTTETVKTLGTNNFREIGNGKYEILFDATELDTVGVFHSEVTGTGIDSVTREDYIIDNIRGVESLWDII